MRKRPRLSTFCLQPSAFSLLTSAFCLLLLTSCITITPRSKQASSTATVIPNMPMQKWGIESCGAGSLSTVLQHYGDARSMQEWDNTLPKTRGGVLTIDLLIAARQRGFNAQLVTGGVDQQLKVWDVKTREKINTLGNQSLNAAYLLIPVLYVAAITTYFLAARFFRGDLIDDEPRGRENSG